MDEARMIFELVDRSGSSGAPRNAPQQPAGESGSNVVDFENQANAAGGAAALAGKNNNAKDAGSSPSVEIPPDTTEALPTEIVSPLPQQQSSSDEKLVPEIPAGQDQSGNQIGELVNLLRQGARDSGLGALIPSSLAPIVSAGESLIDRVISSIPSATSQPNVPPVFTPGSAASPDLSAAPSALQQLVNEVSQAAEQSRASEVPPATNQQFEVSINASEIASSAASVASDVAQAASTAAATAGAAGASTAGTTLAGLAGTAASLAGPLSMAAAAVAVPVATVTSLSSIVEQIRGDIGSLSPEVAQANAEANVRQILANARTAERLGDEIASITESRSRISASLQGIRDVLAEPVLERYSQATGGTAALLTLAEKQIPSTEKYIQSVVRQSMDSALNAALPGAPLLVDALGMIRDMADELGLLEKSKSPIDVYSSEPFLKLPSPFTGNEETGLNADFIDVPGLDLM